MAKRGQRRAWEAGYFYHINLREAFAEHRPRRNPLMPARLPDAQTMALYSQNTR